MSKFGLGVANTPSLIGSIGQFYECYAALLGTTILGIIGLPLATSTSITSSASSIFVFFCGARCPRVLQANTSQPFKLFLKIENIFLETCYRFIGVAKRADDIDMPLVSKGADAVSSLSFKTKVLNP
ncbi:MAG: hypothetical protein AAGA18_15840 [Verrucomicrobiota bacterium]